MWWPYACDISQQTISRAGYVCLRYPLLSWMQENDKQASRNLINKVDQ
jgi:hypothetical protein